MIREWCRNVYLTIWKSGSLWSRTHRRVRVPSVDSSSVPGSPASARTEAEWRTTLHSAPCSRIRFLPLRETPVTVTLEVGDVDDWLPVLFGEVDVDHVSF